MAGPDDYFTPGETDPYSLQMLAPDLSGIAGQVGTFLGDPRVGSGLLGFGLNMLAGPTWGDTGMSHLARSIGAGGESIARSGELGRKERESEAKVELAEARANAAAARAGHAGDRAYLQGEILKQRREVEEGKMNRATLQARVKGSIEYDKYVKDVAKRNSSIMREGPPEQVLPKEDWMRRNGYPTGDVTAPAAGAPSSASGMVPRSDRVVGRTYDTPRGKLKWTGTGWVSPDDEDED